MDKDQIEKVLLEKSRIGGLLTELEVAGIFKKHGFRLELNKYYNDIDEGKGREIDLVATFSRKTDTDEEDYLEMVFKFIVEIKRSEKPWVFTTFPADDFHEKESPFFRFESENFDKLTLAEAFFGTLKEIEDERLGRNFAVIDPKEQKKENDTPIFSALFSVAKAFYAEHFLDSYIKQGKDKLSEKIFEYHELLVVVDAPIYEVFIEDGKEKIQRVSELLVAFNYTSPKYDETSVYIIRVIAKESLDDFLGMRMESFRKISEEILEKEGGGKPFDEEA